jgi:DNA excision repair protein ERCC-2
VYQSTTRLTPFQFYPIKRKLIYCSRTVPEIEKALAELKRLMEYRAEMGAHDEEFRGLGLTSRKNLCLHPEVSDRCSGLPVGTSMEGDTDSCRSARRRRERSWTHGAGI